jgi:hypothetical protein
MSHVVAVCGDLHCGSTVGLCPPEGIELDDGGMYDPSEAQHWLWERWELAWKEAKATIGKRKLTLIVNGDVVDGDHHRTSQIASPLTSLHARCAVESLRVPLALKPKAVHIMRGTPAHVGRSGEAEEGVARTLKNQLNKIVPDPDTGTMSSYRRRIDVEGVRLDVAHHGRMGQRAHTRGSYSRLYSFDIWAEQALDLITEGNTAESAEELYEIWKKKQVAQIAIRSHNHKFQDSGYDHRGITRVISMPAWQLATEYVHRIAAEALADIGIVLLVCDKGDVEVKPILYSPGRSTVLKA